ncbi:hypothetical protein [Streptomyces virginiae]
MATDARLSHAQNLELRKEHNIVGAFVNVPDVDGRTLAYCVTTAVRDFNGNMRTFFNIVTLDGRYISKGYKSAGSVTKWCRANLDEIAPVPAEDPSNQIEPEMVETEDDISDPITPVGRQAWSVVKLSRDAQKYATQAAEHATEAERLELETACYADIAEVVRTERDCAEQISEAKRHTALIASELAEAERLYRRTRWAHAAAYRISSVMFFSDGPWDAVMDDWTERSADAKATALEALDRAAGATEDAGEHVDRAERQLNRACAVCGFWYPCTRDGRTLTADLYDRGGYTCGCGGSTPGNDVPEPIEPCDGQMSFDDVPEPVAPEHVTAVTELDGFFVITCTCGWTHDIDAFTREEFARGRAGMHRRQPHFDAERMAEGPCEQLQKITREIDGTEFTAKWERHQYVIRWAAAALQVGKTAGEAFRRLRAGLKDDPAQFARLMGVEAKKQQGESSSMGRGSKAPKKAAAKVKVGDILFATDSFPTTAQLLGHFYTVRMLAGCYSVKHNASGEALIFTGVDKKNVCRTGSDMFPTRPTMKQAILADAVARGAVEHQEQPEAPNSVTHADLMAVDGEELVALLDSLTEEQREELAAPWPVRWLYPAETPRGLNFCAGCGGGCKGKRLVSDTDMICVDLSGDAVATSEAAGCTVLRADVKTLTPEHPALRDVHDVMFTMPCTDWTIAGKGLGRDASNLEILVEAIAQVGFAFGNYEKDGTEYCDHEENGCFSSYGSRTDMTVPEMWALVDGMTSKTAGLMLAPVIWCLGLRYIGAPLTRVVIEQAAALPEEIKDEIWLELNVAGCEQGEWTVLDAADFGSPSNRKRSIMAVHWYRRPGLPVAPEITTLAHEAIGWEPDAEINTRGDRKTSGGNAFRMDGRTTRHPEPKPINGITSKIRGWYNATTGRRFTIEEVCLLVGLPADYPVVGSRSSQTQQLGDIFSPLVSLAVWGQLLGVPWREMLRQYLAELYPSVHTAEDAAGLEPVAVFIVSAKSNPTRRRVLWGMTRADATRLCSDDRTASKNFMLCWTAPEHLGVLGEDWEWTKDRGTTDAVIAELGVTVLNRELLETAADTAEIPVEESPAGADQERAPADKEEPSYGLRDGERIRYVGGFDSEYAVMLAGDAERWVSGRGADGERLEGSYTFVAPWSHGGKGYSVRFNGKRFVSVDCPSEILPAVRKHAAKRAAPVKAQPTPGLYAPTLHTEERQGEAADECRKGGHAYLWLVVEAEGVSRTLRSYLTCNCTGEKLGNFGRSGPSMNQGTQTKPLGIHDASIASALGVAKRNSYTTKGPWEIVSDTLKRCPVEWDHAKPLKVAHDPAQAKKAEPKAGESGFMAALLEKHVGPDWTPITATADPVFAEVEEEPQAPAQGLAQITRQQRRAAWRLAAGEKIPETPAGESSQISAAADKPEILALEAAPVRLMLEAAPVVLPDTGRATWEPGQRVTLNHRAGTTRYSTFDGVRVEWDDAPNARDYISPRVLWKEGTEPKPEPRGWFAPVVEPGPVVEDADAIDYAAISAAHRAAREDELLAELLTEELEKPEPVEEPDAPSMTWAEVSESLAVLRAELFEEQTAYLPSRTWEELTEDLSDLAAELVPEPVTVTPVRIPRSLRRDLLSIAAAGALVTLTAASVAEVVPPLG